MVPDVINVRAYRHRRCHRRTERSNGVLPAADWEQIHTRTQSHTTNCLVRQILQRKPNHRWMQEVGTLAVKWNAYTWQLPIALCIHVWIWTRMSSIWTRQSESSSQLEIKMDQANNTCYSFFTYRDERDCRNCVAFMQCHNWCSDVFWCTYCLPWSTNSYLFSIWLSHIEKIAMRKMSMEGAFSKDRLNVEQNIQTNACAAILNYSHIFIFRVVAFVEQTKCVSFLLHLAHESPNPLNPCSIHSTAVAQRTRLVLFGVIV